MITLMLKNFHEEYRKGSEWINIRSSKVNGNTHNDQGTAMRYIPSIIAAASIVLLSCTNTLKPALNEQSYPIVKQAIPEAEAAKGVSKKPRPAVALAGNWKLAFQDEFHGADTDLDADDLEEHWGDGKTY